MKKLLRLLEACALIFLTLPLVFLPMKWALKAGEQIGLFVFSAWKSRRKIAVENLSKIISAGQIKTSDPAEQIIRANFRNFGRSLAEVIKIYYGFGKPLIDAVVMEGVEHFHTAKEKGKGVIFITGHCGNWELMALTTGLRFSDVSIVARPIDNPYLNKFIERVRKKYGNSIIYKKGALKPIMQTLKKNGIVGILMDQSVLSNEGYVIDFLGRGAWTTKMPALLARKTNAPVLPAFIHRTHNGHRMIIHPEVELSRNEDAEKAVREDTIKFSGFIEGYIKEHPTEWLWIHRRWKRVKEG